MPKTLLDPDVSDTAPLEEGITAYDKEHFVTYARLLDAEKAGADWREAARIVLHRDPELEPEKTRQCWEAHLTRARWMTTAGYSHLLKMGHAAKES